jgi:hypothetical protein
MDEHVRILPHYGITYTLMTRTERLYRIDQLLKGRQAISRGAD